MTHFRASLESIAGRDSEILRPFSDFSCSTKEGTARLECKSQAVPSLTLSYGCFSGNPIKITSTTIYDWQSDNLRLIVGMGFANSFFHIVVQFFTCFSSTCPLFFHFHFALPPVGTRNRSGDMDTCGKALRHQSLRNLLRSFFTINSCCYLNKITHACFSCSFDS